MAPGHMQNPPRQFEILACRSKQLSPIRQIAPLQRGVDRGQSPFLGVEMAVLHGLAIKNEPIRELSSDCLAHPNDPAPIPPLGNKPLVVAQIHGF